MALLEAARATNTQQIWRQEFLGSRSSTVERSSTRTAAAGTFLRFFQTISENTSLWRLKRLVSLSTYRRYINKCIYNITLHYILKLFIVAKVKNCKVHYGASHTTMSGYDCRNKCVLSFRRNDNSDVAVETSRGRVFEILGPAVANERSPTVTRRDGRTSRRLVDDDRRRVLAGMSAM